MTATITQASLNLISNMFTYVLCLNIYTKQKIPSDNTVPRPVENYRTFNKNVVLITMFRTHQWTL